jgi:tetratricopeptide (TPR) repeat protein
MENATVTITDALNLAIQLQKKGALENAEEIYNQILDKKPNNPDALHLLGLINHQKGEQEKAIELITKAIQSNPNAMYYGNLAMIYEALGNNEKSTKNYLKALEINPDYGGAHLAYYNLAIDSKNKGEINKSIEYYNKAIKTNPNFSEAYWNRSQILLSTGDFKQGWEDYEHRFKKLDPTDPREFNKPKWDGSKLNNKKLLVIGEKDFGDNIQFIRYLQLVKEKGAHITLECKKPLINLFKDLQYIDQIIEKENKVPEIEFDYYIHLMSLPHIFNTELNTIPKQIPIQAKKELVEKFKEKIKQQTKETDFKIGIVWKGNSNQEDNEKRSTKFERFKSLINLPNVKLISLQKEDKDQEIANDLDNQKIIDITSEINSLEDTAAIIENLDLIISVDTLIAHLAGAMNKPTWVLLSSNPNWRWLEKRLDSPWYPSIKLFRQSKEEYWDKVFERVKKELTDVLHKN